MLPKLCNRGIQDNLSVANWGYPFRSMTPCVEESATPQSDHTRVSPYLTLTNWRTKLFVPQVSMNLFSIYFYFIRGTKGMSGKKINKTQTHTYKARDHSRPIWTTFPDRLVVFCMCKIPGSSDVYECGLYSLRSVGVAKHSTWYPAAVVTPHLTDISRRKAYAGWERVILPGMREGWEGDTEARRGGGRPRV